MNTERILKLRDFIAALPPERFNINSWADLTTSGASGDVTVTVERLKHDCGTCACIGGWSQVLFNPNPKFDVDMTSSDDIAAQLGIDYNNAFYLTNPSVNWGDVTQDVAVEVLTLLAETGEVRYKEAIANVQDRQA